MTEVQQKKTLGIAIASLVLGCLFIIPLLGILCSIAALILGIIALIKISKNKDTLQGSGLAIAGIVLGGIGIILLPIIAILAAIAIPNFLRARMSANDNVTTAEVKVISAALETYAADNQGKYPTSENEAIKSANPYFVKSYKSEEGVYGHKYSFTLGEAGYEINAVPVSCGVTANKIITVKTKGEVSTTDCVEAPRS